MLLTWDMSESRANAFSSSALSFNRAIRCVPQHPPFEGSKMQLLGTQTHLNSSEFTGSLTWPKTLVNQSHQRWRGTQLCRSWVIHGNPASSLLASMLHLSQDFLPAKPFNNIWIIGEIPWNFQSLSLHYIMHCTCSFQWNLRLRVRLNLQSKSWCKTNQSRFFFWNDSRCASLSFWATVRISQLGSSVPLANIVCESTFR